MTRAVRDENTREGITGGSGRATGPAGGRWGAQYHSESGPAGASGEAPWGGHGDHARTHSPGPTLLCKAPAPRMSPAQPCTHSGRCLSSAPWEKLGPP